MAWTPQTGASGNGGPSTSLTVTSGSASAVGDTLVVDITFGVGTASKSGTVSDQLGNVYTRVSAVADTGNDQRIEQHVCIVTVAGTPQVKLQFNPTPGTTTGDSISVNVNPFTGSDAASTVDGTGAAQWQATPTTTADLTTSGTFTTATDGDLVVTACLDSATGANPGTIGTGFTLLRTTAGVILKSGYQVQTTHSATTAGLWTAAVNDAHITAAVAVKVASGGGGGSSPSVGLMPRSMSRNVPTDRRYRAQMNMAAYSSDLPVSTPMTQCPLCICTTTVFGTPFASGVC